jgi:hypothetical protein
VLELQNKYIPKPAKQKPIKVFQVCLFPSLTTHVRVSKKIKSSQVTTKEDYNMKARKWGSIILSFIKAYTECSL